MYLPFMDSTMILILPAFIFSIWAQWQTQSTFGKYTRVQSRSGFSAWKWARKLLDEAGLNQVSIEKIPGKLTDHYDPMRRVLRLSVSTADSSSVAAIGVAAHEVGHAIQHGKEYAPLMIRNGFVPIANLGSTAGMPLFFIGLFFSIPILLDLGIIFFCGAVLFHFVTLPVEFDASRRAVLLLQGDFDQQEILGVRAVLNAAAMTYIAATAMAVLQLMRLLMLRESRE